MFSIANQCTRAAGLRYSVWRLMPSWRAACETLPRALCSAWSMAALESSCRLSTAAAGNRPGGGQPWQPADKGGAAVCSACTMSSPRCFPAQGVFALASMAQAVRNAGVLAQVARAGVGGQALRQVRRHLHGVGQTCSVARSASSCSRQGGEVGALAQGGQLHRQAVEAVVQIVPEAPLLGRLRQLAMRGADEAKIHRHGVACAHGRHAAVLQHAQQAGLQGGSGMSPISSRNNVPPWALAQAAQAAFPAGTGEGTATWPNSSDSMRCSGMAAQLMATKGPARRGPLAMQGAQTLPAHARFALDEHRNGLATTRRALSAAARQRASPVSKPARASSADSLAAGAPGVPRTTRAAGQAAASSCTCAYSSAHRAGAAPGAAGGGGGGARAGHPAARPAPVPAGGAHVAHVQAQLGEGHAVGAHDPAIRPTRPRCLRPRCQCPRVRGAGAGGRCACRWPPAGGFRSCGRRC